MSTHAHLGSRIAILAMLVLAGGCAKAASLGAPGSSATAATTVPAASSASATPSVTGNPVTSAPASSAPPATPAATNAPPCGIAGLKIALVHDAAAAGTVSGQIGFTNLTSASCHLTGWPVVMAVTAAGAQTLAGHLLTTEFGPNVSSVPVVTLKPHETAISVVVGNDMAGQCASGPALTFRHLIIAPPGAADRVTISAWLPAVNSYLPACGPISVTPVAPTSAMPPLG